MDASEALSLLLALLLKWKVLEAFVVPTGAMAPTIYGVHADAVCQNCGMRYGVTMSMAAQNPLDRSPLRAACPNCGQPSEIGVEAPILQGDRILVDKVSQPRRWDVFVFRFPKDRRMNYVKRLVGLPGDTLEIADGGIFINGQRLTRLPSQAWDMWLLVHDTNLRPKRVLPDGPHWEPKSPISRWKLVDGDWTFDGINAIDKALVFSGPLTDQIAYNEQPPIRELSKNAPLVGDIQLMCDLKRFSGEGNFALRWEFRGRKVMSRISADEEVEMLVSTTAAEDGKPHVTTVRGKLQDSLAKVGRLGFAVRDGVAYALQGNRVLAKVPVGPQDLASVKLQKEAAEPCKLAILGSRCNVALSRIQLWRDTYYCNLSRMRGAERFPAWGCTGLPIHLGKSEYFVLGDNSSVSSDSRFWGPVPAGDAIGVGRLIYWPYGRWHQFQ